MRSRAIPVFAALLVSGAAFAGLPAGQQELGIYISEPEKKGETIISISANWNNPLDWVTAATSLVIANGSDQKHPDTASTLAKKTAKAIKVSMIAHDPGMRGMDVSLDESGERPKITVKNNQDNEITRFEVRDYTNQNMTIESGGASFSAAGVQVSIDAVDASAIDTLDQFSAKPKDKKKLIAGGGGIDLTLGDGKTESIETENRSLEDIEKSIASALGGKFSSSPLLPDQDQRDTRNIKPFDGGEARFTALNGKSITINVNDPTVGVITRLKFPGGPGGGTSESSSNMMWIVLLLLAAGGGYYYYTTTVQKDETDETGEG